MDDNEYIGEDSLGFSGNGFCPDSIELYHFKDGQIDIRIDNNNCNDSCGFCLSKERAIKVRDFLNKLYPI